MSQIRDRDRILSSPIPVLLLKTQSTPDDAYEELFNQKADDVNSQFSFQPYFIPVLEHQQAAETLSGLGRMIGDGSLRQKYGGMIFTSQRAVEGWTETVTNIEKSQSKDLSPTQAVDPFATMDNFIPFPLYSVGPATSRNLDALLESLSHLPHSSFKKVNPQVLGEHTGNGASLASFILKHYNDLHDRTWYDYFEAPRLPFIPLLGMSSENYGRKRLDPSDTRLQKRPLLFLVGEKRRDIIPRTLMDPGPEDKKMRIEVEEVEVYKTEVMASFADDLTSLLHNLDQKQQTLSPIRVIVVFSPLGSDQLLQTIGILDDGNRITNKAKQEWKVDGDKNVEVNYIVVTIGPTTRDYLQSQFGFDAHVCASKPSPDALMQGIVGFLKANFR